MDGGVIGTTGAGCIRRNASRIQRAIGALRSTLAHQQLRSRHLIFGSNQIRFGKPCTLRSSAQLPAASHSFPFVMLLTCLSTSPLLSVSLSMLHAHCAKQGEARFTDMCAAPTWVRQGLQCSRPDPRHCRQLWRADQEEQKSACVRSECHSGVPPFGHRTIILKGIERTVERYQSTSQASYNT